MTDPVVSIVMPVYNSERFLRDAVAGALAQTFDGFELIAIDDGSTDGSKAILDELAASDPRIRVISRPNMGISATRNEGTQLARGAFIAVMDSDDISLPNRLELHVTYLRAHPDSVAVGGRVLLVDPDNEPLCVSDLFEPTHESICAAMLEGRSGAISHPSCMIRRDALRTIGGYDERYKIAEDYDMFLRLAEVGRLGNVPETVVRYRQHLASTCHRLPVQMYNAIKAILSQARRKRLLPDLHLTSEPSLSIAAKERIWAWWALRSGHVTTARKHALQSMRLAPLNWESWRVMACSIRGH